MADQSDEPCEPRYTLGISKAERWYRMKEPLVLALACVKIVIEKFATRHHCSLADSTFRPEKSLREVHGSMSSAGCVPSRFSFRIWGKEIDGFSFVCMHFEKPAHALFSPSCKQIITRVMRKLPLDWSPSEAPAKSRGAEPAALAAALSRL